LGVIIERSGDSLIGKSDRFLVQGCRVPARQAIVGFGIPSAGGRLHAKPDLLLGHCRAVVILSTFGGLRMTIFAALTNLLLKQPLVSSQHHHGTALISLTKGPRRKINISTKKAQAVVFSGSMSDRCILRFGRQNDSDEGQQSV
jgi:hypothetical protein